MTNGRAGVKPEWYDPLTFAQMFSMNPDEVIRLPVYWIEAAAIKTQVENEVREKKEKQKKSNKGNSTNNAGSYKGYGRKRRR